MEDKTGAGNDRPLTIKELSERSPYSIPTLRRLVRDRKIPYFQPAGKGGKLSFPPDAIERMCILPDGPPGQPTESSETMSQKHLSGPRPKWTRSNNTMSEDKNAAEK
jgi:hypothetical protein